MTITFDDHTIQNQWLEVTVKADPSTTGLTEPDVFYFGNALGETGNSAFSAKVGAQDVLEARNNPRTFFDPATIDTVHDFNRDRRVNAIDTLIARNNQTWSGTELELVDLSGSKAAVIRSNKQGAEARFVNVLPQNNQYSEAVGRVFDRAKTPGDEWAWLHEFDRMNTTTRPSDKGVPSEKAVDKLLALWDED